MASPVSLLPEQALASLPTELRGDLLGEFGKIVGNYSEGRWEPAELDGGKLAEAAYTICEGWVSGTMSARAKKPARMLDACRALEQAPAAGNPRSVRILIPRMLPTLYEIRNNRSVGHVGGDVNPNHMDSLFVLQTSKWVIGEFIRISHALPVDDAQDLVEALVECETPLVWKVGGKKRVLDPALSMPDKTLLLLHSTVGSVSVADLVDWTEHTNEALFRRDVLRRAHKAKLLEFDESAVMVTISPRGIAKVEEKIIRPRNKK